MRILLLSWWRLVGLAAMLAGLAWCVGSGVVSPVRLALYLALALFGAWTTPKTWTAVVVTVADLNTHIRDNLNYLKGVVDSLTIDNSVCQGRLTLTTGVPVTIADVLAATTLRFALYGGNQIALYSGTVWATFTFPELSVAVPATTSTMYDAFVYDNAGTRTLEVLAWTNDTTRATALVTQDGVLCKSGALTRRYVGSFRTTTVSGQTEDSYAKRYVWSYYHRVTREMRVFDPANSWTYTTATWRQANANAANQLDCVVGVAEVPVRCRVQAGATNTNAGINVAVSIAQDSVTNPATADIQLFGAVSTPVAAYFVAATASAVFYPAAGRRLFLWQEYSQAVGTTTWYGDNGAGDAGPNSGIVGELEG